MRCDVIMSIEANCTFKPHIQRIMIVPGRLAIDGNTLTFKAYGKELTPFSVEFDTTKIVRYKHVKGLLGHKLFIYYSDHEWYKFSQFSKEELINILKELA